MTTKPFRILGLQQIAIGAPDKGPLRTLWCDILGLATKGQFRSERENVDEDICALGHGVHEVEVDLMQPIDPAAKPAVHATPLNHVGLWVDDLAKAVAWMTANGVRFAPAFRDLFFGLPGRLPWVHDQSVAALSGLKTGWLAGRFDLARYDPPPLPSTPS